MCRVSSNRSASTPSLQLFELGYEVVLDLPFVVLDVACSAF